MTSTAYIEHFPGTTEVFHWTNLVQQCESERCEYTNLVLIDDLESHMHPQAIAEFNQIFEQRRKFKATKQSHYLSNISRVLKQFLYKEKNHSLKHCKYKEFIIDASFRLIDIYINILKILIKSKATKTLIRKEIRIMKHTHCHIRKRWNFTTFKKIFTQYILEFNRRIYDHSNYPCIRQKSPDHVPCF